VPDGDDPDTLRVEGQGSGDLDAAQVRAVLDALRDAERPAVISGYGVLRAQSRDLLVQLSERLAVPVFASWRRPTAFPNDHPNYLGMTGYGSPDTVLERLSAADFLLVIGCRLNEVTTFAYKLPADNTRWAHVDLEPRQAHAGLRAPDHPLTADARAFLQAALAATGTDLDESQARARREAIAGDRRAYLEATTFDPNEEWRGPGIHPGKVIATLERVLPRDALLTSDAGNFGNWQARGFHFAAGQGFLGPTSGAMGYGLPAAIAASLAQPQRTVVALCGDGGFAMTMNELDTAARHGAHPIALVFDNERYGTIAMHQRNQDRALVATELGPIDFATAARALGAQGGRVTRDSEFEPALRDAMAARVPAVVHLEMDARWISPDRYGE
jgi:acetolactate synthase-1/2/3 large subunit